MQALKKKIYNNLCLSYNRNDYAFLFGIRRTIKKRRLHHFIAINKVFEILTIEKLLSFNFFNTIFYVRNAASVTPLDSPRRAELIAMRQKSIS